MSSAKVQHIDEAVHVIVAMRDRFTAEESADDYLDICERQFVFPRSQ